MSLYREIYCRRLVTETQGSTFVDAKFGMEPRALSPRMFDTLAGKRYVRRWAGTSLDALRRAATKPTRAPA